MFLLKENQCSRILYGVPTAGIPYPKTHYRGMGGGMLLLLFLARLAGVWGGVTYPIWKGVLPHPIGVPHPLAY